MRTGCASASASPRAEQAAEVAGYADGVIVGSAFVRPLLEAASPAAGLDAVRAVAADLSAGVRGAVRTSPPGVPR